MAIPTVDSVLDDWCAQEACYWSSVYTGARDFSGEFARLNETYETVFVLDVSHGNVVVRRKAGLVGDDGTIAGGTQPAVRIRHYRDFIENSVRRYAPDLETTFALDVHDVSAKESSAPIFSFQKLASSHNLLLPDIDFITFDFYGRHHEEAEASAKIPHAVFYGSSTGGGILNRADVMADRSERLGFARDLHGRERIHFHIGHVAQCDTPETGALLAAKPYFAPGVGWEQQLAYAFIISVDGNGATCSRVVNTLRSQSALIKITSLFPLYYFKGLRPWEHYIPASNVADLDGIMDDHARGEIDVAGIVARANRFFEHFLSKESVHLYMAKLLSCYERTIVSRPEACSAALFERKLISGVVAHIAGIGDVSSPADRWLQFRAPRPVEGFQVNAASGVSQDSLRYRCMGHDGDWSPWCSLGTFAGTRGQSRPLYGIAFKLGSAIARHSHLRCEIIFQDGTRQTLGGRSGKSRAKTASPIVDMKLTVLRLDRDVAALPQRSGRDSVQV